MEQPAFCLFHLHVNLWKCEGDISGERSGPLFKFPVQTARARLDVVWVLVCISPALTSVLFLRSNVNFVSLVSLLIKGRAALGVH
jgi:hypothetical protein